MSRLFSCNRLVDYVFNVKLLKSFQSTRPVKQRSKRTLVKRYYVSNRRCLPEGIRLGVPQLEELAQAG